MERGNLKKVFIWTLYQLGLDCKLTVQPNQLKQEEEFILDHGIQRMIWRTDRIEDFIWASVTNKSSAVSATNIFSVCFIVILLSVPVWQLIRPVKCGSGVGFVGIWLLPR